MTHKCQPHTRKLMYITNAVSGETAWNDLLLLEGTYKILMMYANHLQFNDLDIIKALFSACYIFQSVSSPYKYWKAEVSKLMYILLCYNCYMCYYCFHNYNYCTGPIQHSPITSHSHHRQEERCYKSQRPVPQVLTHQPSLAHLSCLGCFLYIAVCLLHCVITSSSASSCPVYQLKIVRPKLGQ